MPFSGDGWRLANVVERNQDSPDFKIPPVFLRENLVPGYCAKLVFEMARPSLGIGSERMWVIVKSKSDGMYEGTLDNDPEYINTLTIGATVKFGPEHVADILKPLKKKTELGN